MSGGGKTAALGIAATALVLLVSSALDMQLGLPTAIAGSLTAVVVLFARAQAPWTTLKGISWGVLPLVAGLFVLVEALDRTGLIRIDRRAAARGGAALRHEAAWGAGVVIAFACNLMNNLPAGLIAGNAVQGAHVPDRVTRAVLIGVDLGPNLSVTGSLATILWLTALRREGQSVGAWTFLKLGLLVMPPGAAAGDRGGHSVHDEINSEDAHARHQRRLALSDHHRGRSPAGLGAADERRAAQRADQSLAGERRLLLAHRRLPGRLFFCLPRPLPTAEGIAGMPWWAPLGGLVGAFAVVAGLLFVDKVGAGAFAGLTITANILMSLRSTSSAGSARRSIRSAAGACWARP